jgi:hypothetical protein
VLSFYPPHQHTEIRSVLSTALRRSAPSAGAAHRRPGAGCPRARCSSTPRRWPRTSATWPRPSTSRT